MNFKSILLFHKFEINCEIKLLRGGHSVTWQLTVFLFFLFFYGSFHKTTENHDTDSLKCLPKWYKQSGTQLISYDYKNISVLVAESLFK